MTGNAAAEDVPLYEMAEAIRERIRSAAKTAPHAGVRPGDEPVEDVLFVIAEGHTAYS